MRVVTISIAACLLALMGAGERALGAPGDGAAAAGGGRRAARRG